MIRLLPKAIATVRCGSDDLLRLSVWAWQQREAELGMRMQRLMARDGVARVEFASWTDGEIPIRVLRQAQLLGHVTCKIVFQKSYLF